MNLLPHTVTKILAGPYERREKWFLKVQADRQGTSVELTLTFSTKEEARNVSIGYEFNAQGSALATKTRSLPCQ